jgi:hypothetical protein
VPKATPEQRVTVLERLMQEKDNELKRAKRSLGTSELEVERLSKALDLIRSIKDASPKVPVWRAPVPSTSKKSGNKGIPCLLLSDLHLDEVVDPSEVEWYNKYDREIAEARLKHTFDTAVRLSQDYVSGIDFDGFVLMLGGDILSGDIHLELAKSNEASLFESVVHWVPQLAAGIELLANVFGKVYVPCVVGNHDRNPANKRSPSKGRAKDAVSWIIYHWLADRFRGDTRITFDVAEGADKVFSVYDTKYLLTHGDQFKGGGGIGGIYVPIMRGVAKKQQRQAIIGQPFDWAVMGHWHQHIFGQGVIINGSLKGYDEYAYTSNFAPEPPTQAFWVTTPDRGITVSMPIHSEAKGETWRTK